VLVALASVWFLRRIREQTPAALLAAAIVALAGVGLLGALVVVERLEADYPVSAIIVGLIGAGVLWWSLLRRRRPWALRRVGVFDAAESADVLPGAGVFAPDANGDVVLIGRAAAGRPPGRRAG
jgi:O-antigen/teichoic acid export membrane protein